MFELVRATGGVARAELEQTFNLGVGMVAVVPADRSAAALELLAERGVPAWELGRMAPGNRDVRLVGEYSGAASTWR